MSLLRFLSFFFFNDTATTEIYTLSLHDALPISMTPERVKEGLLDVALELEKKQRAFAEKQGIRLYGELRLGHHGSEAICHSKILEGHAEPGMVIIGSECHTPQGSEEIRVGEDGTTRRWPHDVENNGR